MNDTPTQSMIFPDLNSDTFKVNYQIKQVDDPSFKVNFSSNPNDNPEATALELLGYFIVPEITT